MRRAGIAYQLHLSTGWVYGLEGTVYIGDNVFCANMKTLIPHLTPSSHTSYTHPTPHTLIPHLIHSSHTSHTHPTYILTLHTLTHLTVYWRSFFYNHWKRVRELLSQSRWISSRSQACVYEMTMGCGGYKRGATITTLSRLTVKITRKRSRYLGVFVPSITTPTNGGMCSQPPPWPPPWRSPAQNRMVVNSLKNKTEGLGMCLFNQSDLYLESHDSAITFCTYTHVRIYMYHAHHTHHITPHTTSHYTPHTPHHTTSHYITLHTTHTTSHYTPHTTHHITLHTTHTTSHYTPHTTHTTHIPCIHITLHTTHTTHITPTPFSRPSDEATLYMTKKAITTEIGSAFHEVLEQFGCTRDLKEKERIGSDMTNVAIGHMIRGRLCSALAGLLLDGLKPYRMEGLVVDDIWKVTVAFCQEGGSYTL